jgi:hypothetical protein
MRQTLSLVVIAALALPNGARSQPNPYTVANGRITSAMQPEIRLEYDTALTYLGSQRWILYNVAQAEQHLFVERGPEGARRFLWVQFEEYIPSSNGRYDYSRSAPLSAFGRELRVDKSLFRPPATEARPESDGAYARRLLREKGVTLPEQMLMERFIYLPDTTRRRELMVIYAEDAKWAAGTMPLEGGPLNALLAEHERRGLQSFKIVSK